MAFKIADAYVEITGQTAGLGAGVSESVSKDEGGFFHKSGTIIGGILGANLVMAAVNVVKNGFGAALSEAEDQNAVTAQLNAGLKSTGDVSGESVTNIVKRATALSTMSGITRTSIEDADSLLLSFTNIKNTPIAPVFDEATTAIANMVARKGGDPVQYATALGRALQDPIGGLALLTRQGVTFTAAQKDQIKAFVDSGNAAGAQGIILDQLNVKFGGSAKAAGETLPGAISRLKNSLTDMGGDMIDKLIPVIVPFFDKLVASVIKLEPELEKMEPSFIKLLPPLTKIILDVLPLLPPLLDLVVDVLNLLEPVIDFVAQDLDLLFGMLDQVVKFLEGGVSPQQFMKDFDDMAHKVGYLGDFAVTMQTDVGDAVTWIVKTVADFREKWQNYWLAVQTDVWIFEQNVEGAIGGAVKWVESLPTAVEKAVAGAGTWLVDTGENIVNGLVTGIENTIGSVEKTLEKGLKGALDAVKSFLGIKSPSALFRDEVGSQIGAGIAAGVDTSAPDIVTAIKKATTPGSVGSSGYDGDGMSATPSGSSSGAVGIVQKFYIAAGAFVIDAKNVKDWQDVVDMLNSLGLVATTNPTG